MSDLYSCLHRTKEGYLPRAWQKVRANALSSQSKETREKVKIFDESAPVELPKIQRQLREDRFHFDQQRGVPIEKKKGSGKHRPVVLAPVKNRIVQRALLDVLQQKVPAVKRVLLTETSIGGIPGRGTRHAVQIIERAMREGATYFASSDISGFFTKIPRDKVVDFIDRNTKDKKFIDLFARAIETTLVNEAELGEHRDLFPITKIGVAQGSPLSPLMGNILLNGFDGSLNGRDVTCVRYIDDFIILGPNKRSVDRAMKNAIDMLSEFSMSVYDPTSHPDKAETGPVTKGFNFLGCHINPGQVAPSRDARQKLMEKVQRAISDGRKAVHTAADAKSPIEAMQCQVQTLIRLDGILKGWGHAFSFCNTPQVFDEIDAKADKEISEFMALCHSLGAKKSPKSRRRILGVHLLSDTPCMDIQQ